MNKSSSFLMFQRRILFPLHSFSLLHCSPTSPSHAVPLCLVCQALMIVSPLYQLMPGLAEHYFIISSMILISPFHFPLSHLFPTLEETEMLLGIFSLGHSCVGGHYSSLLKLCKLLSYLDTGPILVPSSTELPYHGTVPKQYTVPLRILTQLRGLWSGSASYRIPLGLGKGNLS